MNDYNNWEIEKLNIRWANNPTCKLPGKRYPTKEEMKHAAKDGFLANKFDTHAWIGTSTPCGRSNNYTYAYSVSNNRCEPSWNKNLVNVIYIKE